MAAYAALVSLMNLIEQIQNHPHPPITLDNKQVESLTKKIAFLEGFLEAYNTCDGDQEVDPLRSRIADAAYAAEDVIESHIVDQIHDQSPYFRGDNIISLRDFFEEAGGVLQNPIANTTKDITESTTHDGESISSIEFYQSLQLVIESMDFIGKEVMEIEGKKGTQDQLQRIITTPVVSSESSSTEHDNMVGVDDVIHKVLDKLTGGQSCRQILPISGMGGIGKTTLAKNVYTNPLIMGRFDVRAWVTISNDYNVRDILVEILVCLKQGNKQVLSQKSEKDLVIQLYQCLLGRRYLIIMDDMWSIEAWDKVKFSFPPNDNRSRIVITTRMSNLASNFDGNLGFEMSLLDDDKSWDLLSKTMFGERGCPHDLEEIGKRIAKNCKGLPLSIVVIGGLLTKSKQTREYWEYIADNLNSVVNLADNERCFKILRTSYNQLPIHLKPCFLYMGSFPEDGKIDISKLIKQWVAEGFLKPNKIKCLEEIAEEYLADLIARNLILVITNESGEKPIYCKIHDLLRDLCLIEAQNDKFLCVTSQHNPNIIPHGISTQRRFAILKSTSNEEYQPQVLHALESASLARSLIIHFEEGLPSLGFRLLRVLKAVGSRKRSYSMANIFQLMNARYLDVTGYWDPIHRFSPSIYLLWNLQTLIVSGISRSTIALSELGKMPLLRHVNFSKLYLISSDEMDKQDDFVMENLQTISRIHDFKFSEEVVKRIPNVKQLKIHYENHEGFGLASHYCLNNLGHLHKLESLSCNLRLQKLEFDFQNGMSLPNSLKELSLIRCRLDWEDVNIKIGSLPCLQRLTLGFSHFTGSEWETVEEQFISLKYLRIYNCSNLEIWTTESTHFPRLEHLHISGLEELMKIPSDIGDIPTLKLISLSLCSDATVISAQRIQEEQEENGNEDLKVRVTVLPESELMKLSSRNFRVECARN